MDPFSVLGVMNSALTTSNTIATLIKACCEARGDLKKAKKQVKGLQSVLDKLKSMENVGSTQKGTLKALKALKPCGKILSDIDILLEDYVNMNVRWAVFGKAKLDELQQKLEISKTTLSLYSNTAIINSLGGLGKRTNNLENKTDSVGKKVTSIEKKMDTVGKKVTVIDKKMEGIEKKTGGVEKRMASIEKRMNGIERKTDGMEKKVTGMEKKTDRVEKKMTIVENKVDGVGKKIDGVEKKVNGMEKKIDALDDMKKKVDTMEKQLAAIFNARKAQQDGVKRGKPNVNVVEEGSAQSRPKTQQIPTSRSLTDVCIRIKATCSTIESLQKRRSARDDLKSTNDKLTQLSELITQYAAMDDRSSPSSSTSHRYLVAVDTATDGSINIISEIDIILYNYAYMRWSWGPEGKDMMAKQW